MKEIRDRVRGKVVPPTSWRDHRRDHVITVLAEEKGAKVRAEEVDVLVSRRRATEQGDELCGEGSDSMAMWLVVR